MDSTGLSNADHPFVRFLAERLYEILEREENNTSHAYLYPCGGSWFAFERSAYAVCRQFSLDSKVAILKLKADGRIVVMVGLDDWQRTQMPVKVKISVIAFCMWKQSVIK